MMCTYNLTTVGLNLDKYNSPLCTKHKTTWIGN